MQQSLVLSADVIAAHKQLILEYLSIMAKDTPGKKADGRDTCMCAVHYQMVQDAIRKATHFFCSNI